MSAAAFLNHFASAPHIARRVADVTFDAATGCWLWPSKSYIKISNRGSKRYLHRTSLEIKLGRELGPLEARHDCDTPRCFNPDHLRPGTHAENQRDMAERGRSRNKPVRGVANNKATLTNDEIVEALRMLDAGATYTAVAARYGVTRRAVRTWRDGTARLEAHELWIQASERRSA